MFATTQVKALSACTIYERLLLQVILAEFRRTGLEEARLDRCIEQMREQCQYEGES